MLGGELGGRIARWQLKQNFWPGTVCVSSSGYLRFKVNGGTLEGAKSKPITVGHVRTVTKGKEMGGRHERDGLRHVHPQRVTWHTHC